MAGRGEEDDVIRDTFGLLQLVVSMASATKFGEEEFKPYSPLILFSLLSEGFLGLMVTFALDVELSDSISSSVLDFELSRLIEVGLNVPLPSDEVSRLGKGLVLV